MTDEFELEERAVAVELGAVTALFARGPTEGSELRDGLRTVRTVLAVWDDAEHTRLRPAEYPGTVSPVALKDGRVAISGLWAKGVLARSDKAVEPVASVEALRPARLAPPLVADSPMVDVIEGGSTLTPQR